MVDSLFLIYYNKITVGHYHQGSRTEYSVRPFYWEVQMSGVIFVAGSYGVGKSTLCKKLSSAFSIPFYSAGDLISEFNGETYGPNKVVKDKNHNQDILIDAVNDKLQTSPSIILAGHFCIFDNLNHVEKLPEYVFDFLPIQSILLLEANTDRIICNLQNRDGKKYLPSHIDNLKIAEHFQAYKIANKLQVPIHVHQMEFNDSDIDKVLSIL